MAGSGDIETINISDDDEEIMIMREDNSGQIVFYSCYHCNQKFITYGALDSHIKFTPLKELEESILKKTTSVLQSHSLTMDMVDVEKKKKTKCKGNVQNCEIVYPCPLCSYTCTRICQFKNHIALMHSDIQPFENVWPGYQSIDKKKLNQQTEKVHSRKKFYDCKVCNYKGTRIFHLTRHMIKYHAKDGYFKCNVCHFKTVSAFLLNQHVKKTHN